MKAFLYGILLQWKMNLRSKEILIHYYIVPLIFYLFIGGIFTSILPESDQTLIQAMAVFGATMGGVLGSPYPLVELFGGDIKKAYQVGTIPLWSIAAGNFISALLHLFLMSMIIFLTAPLFFHAAMPQNYGAYFLELILLIMANLSVGTAFGLFLKSASKLGMATQLIFLPSILLSGIMFPTSMLPNVLQYAGRLLPATWGFQAMCAPGLSFSQLAPLGIMIVLLIGLSAWRLKKLSAES